MKNRLHTVVAGLSKPLVPLFLLAVALPLRADVVTDWNQTALNAIKADKTTPPQASRNLAILHIAIYDAVNGVNRTHQPYLVRKKSHPQASADAAAAAAGHVALVALYPAQQALFDARYATLIGAIPAGKGRNYGIAWGEQVANEILQARANDGSTNVVIYTPGVGPGLWQQTLPAFAPALLPQWPNVTPFAMTEGAQFRPPPPPALSSGPYAFDLNLTKSLGSATSATRTPDQTAIARFWGDGAGTVTPPGHWNVIAQDIAAQLGNTMPQNARLFALLNIAEADAAICSWDAKYAYNYWRPVTAIRAADTDGNPATDPDPTWTPLLGTPPFPEYTSGHSTFSGAAATVLARFFGNDQIAFTTASEDLPGVTRSFSSFWDAAYEAGLSRIFGGIHYMAANVQGLSCGTQIGTLVADNLLLERGKGGAED
jgi:membrane-associated phospholipid phosphatase